MLTKLVIDLAKEIPPSAWTVIFLEKWERLLDVAAQIDTETDQEQFVTQVKTDVSMLKASVSPAQA